MLQNKNKADCTVIKFLDLKASYLELKQEFDDAYHRVMDSGWYLLGEETERFEEEYASFCGVDHCVTVANGMDGLVLALRAFDVGPGDEVIVPAHTFIASWLAITQVGATPVPVEPHPETYNIDPEKIDAAISKNTRCIMPVHLYGQPADMDPILEIANRHNLIVLEDAAQSQGAQYKTQRSGSLGHAAAHSFYPGKNLGAFSDGGAVTSNDPKFSSKIRMLRNYGSQVKYQHEVPGVNSRIDEFQAAVLRIKLRHLDQWNSRRSEIAANYLKRLADLPGITLPKILEDSVSAWHLFVIRHSDRDQLQNQLRKREINTLIHYPTAPHVAGAYKDLGYEAGAFPIAEELTSTLLSLPIGPQQPIEATDRVIAAVREIVTAGALK